VKPSLETEPENAETAGPDGLNVQALSDWLTSRVPEFTAPARVRMLSAGRSNIIYELIDSNDKRYVLRRPPQGGTAARTHDVMREWRILEALDRTAVPTPPLVAMCESDSVIGAPFFVMAFVDARPLNFETAQTLSTTAQQQLQTSLADTLQTLHSVDIDAIGLGSFRRTRSVVERQVALWQARLDKLVAEIAPDMHTDMTDLGRRLVARQPTAAHQRLVHGDFKADNLMVGDDGHVVAVLDWELTTTGDPLFDLAWLLMWWGDDYYTGPWLSTPTNHDRQLCSGHAIAERYLSVSAVDGAQLSYYLAFAYWRLSAINLVTRARFASGAMAGKSLDMERMDAQLQWQVQASRGHLDANTE